MISTQAGFYFSVVTEKHNGVYVCGREITVRVITVSEVGDSGRPLVPSSPSLAQLLVTQGE